MNRLVKALSPLIITGAAITCAHAEATPVQQQLDVALYKDGHQIAMGTSIIKDEIVGKAPYAMRSGTEIGYGRCTKCRKYQSRKRNQPRERQRLCRARDVHRPGCGRRSAGAALSQRSGYRVRGKHEDGPADCRSETVSTKGLKVNKVIVDIADGQSIDVPLGDTHYRLALKLHNADL